MSTLVTPLQADAVASLCRTHPQAPPMDVLDLVFRGSAGAVLKKDAPWAAPWEPFGQVVAAAFDRAMTPQEWATLSRPPADPILRTALCDIWRHEVLSAFADRYGLLPR